MILYRHNGETICLTPEEMREIHQEVERANMIDDIGARFQELELAEPAPSEMAVIVSTAESALSRNSRYHDTYWASIDAAIDEWRSKHGQLDWHQNVTNNEEAE